MPRRVVIGVGIASYPLHAAGNTWAFLQWVLGFRAGGLGRLDGRGCSAVPNASTRRPERARPQLSANLAHWNNDRGRVRPEGPRHAFLRRPVAGTARACSASRATPNSSSTSPAISSSATFSPRCAQRIYVDLDPAFTQIWAEVYQVRHEPRRPRQVRLHRTASRPRRIAARRWPDATWLPVGVAGRARLFHQPGRGRTGRRLDHLHPLVRLSRRSNTTASGTATNRRSSPGSSICPDKTKEKLEIATDLHPEDQATRQFLESGWSLIDARPLNTPWQRYRDYLAQSRGEFCVAKNGYVRSRCGWFSDRSVTYLALGRPVILQETGWTDFYPHGEGLLSFHDEESAPRGAGNGGERPGQTRPRRARASRRNIAPRPSW